MKRTLVIIALAVLALTGCNKEMAHNPIASNNDGELSVLPMESNGSIATRGYVEGSKFQETLYESLHKSPRSAADSAYRTMQISAYLYPQNGEQKNYFVDKTYAKGASDDLWHNTKTDGTVDPIYWPVGGTLDFLAYSVSAKDSKNITAVWNSEDAANNVTLKVPAENSQNDILFASAYGIESRSSAQAVAMKFNHAQAWLEFVLTGSTDDVNTDGIVTLKRIELENVYNAGTLAIDNNNGNATAKWNFTGEQRQNIEVDNCYGVAKLNAAPQYLDMLIPQQTKTAFVLYYTLGSSAKELSYRFTTDQKTWLMGEKYVYSINIKTSEVTVKPSVTEWNDVKEFKKTLSVSSNDPNKGTVEVECFGGDQISEGIYEFGWGGQATLTAKPLNDYPFFKWSDGSTENPRTITVTADAEYEAIFGYKITAESKEYNPTRGTAYVEYTDLNQATITATPAEGYKFFRWMKDDVEISRDATRPVVASGDSAYVAEFIPNEAIAALFSVSATKQIVFTSGNLKWNGSAFSTESSQTTYQSSRSASNVGHFFYSKAASIAYAETYSDASRNYGDIFFTNAAETTPNPEFTCNGKTGVFRTLSEGEWTYLRYRTVKGKSGYNWVSVNGTIGFIFYPDNYTGKFFETYETITEIPDGCVFLPFAGFFNGSSVNNAGSTGYYWSASPSPEQLAGAFWFKEGSVAYTSRNNGASVRLVSEL